MKLVAAMALARLRFERLPGRTMTVRQMPTLSPDGGLEMRVRPRDPETAESPRITGRADECYSPFAY